ncbi:MAG: AAA family ATPase [Gomphosphaeria aponina SAG 52.96 = DSM 107014]|uniref:AAA family ATPase n=1 Tax=Gomphosphaeria aponina SAG 52.96 = DSM 107014 TaxID=1521640 RepID=A0A941JSI0_9CHRO|nr:AAA family ATPase [Gomphosphaeria aponina SAG 52.96 = DSM 107014]
MNKDEELLKVTFAQLYGQHQAVELLKSAIINNRLAPGYLFAGPAGIGKGLAAKCFSQLLMGDNPLNKKRLQAGNHPDFLWVMPTYLHQGQLLTPTEATAAGLKRKAPPQIRIEQVREITQFLSSTPLEAPRAVVVIEDAQKMAESAANALLKTLEEPGKATIILIAPGSDSLLPTLVSRCQRIPFYRLNEGEMKRVLQEKGYEEILTHRELLMMAAGSPGEAIASFTQLQAMPPILLEKFKKVPSNPHDALTLAKEVDKTLDTEAQLWLIEYLQHFYWEKMQKKEIIEQLEKARQCLLSYVQPRLVWECTLLAVIQ